MEVSLPTDLVQTNLARLAIIAGGILRDVYAAQSVNIYTYEAYVDQLERWLAALPSSLRFHIDHSGGNLGPEKSRGDSIATVCTPPASLTELTVFYSTIWS